MKMSLLRWILFLQIVLTVAAVTNSVEITRIRQLLVMFEKAKPPRIEVIYLDEDYEDCLNNDLVTFCYDKQP